MQASHPFLEYQNSIYYMNKTAIDRFCRMASLEMPDLIDAGIWKVRMTMMTMCC